MKRRRKNIMMKRAAEKAKSALFFSFVSSFSRGQIYIAIKKTKKKSNSLFPQRMLDVNDLS